MPGPDVKCFCCRDGKECACGGGECCITGKCCKEGDRTCCGKCSNAACKCADGCKCEGACACTMGNCTC
uniref:Metallothionein n=1 Tax=Lytechinus pictus TaxID=7653 RepID=MT_LYTPI|nr:RecName: Full=Metallothionein; Short=MT; AltName: Full=LpMT1 [Lytechinus pictus]AAB58321.1 metallothionein [Lytechinus pictus]